MTRCSGDGWGGRARQTNCFRARGCSPSATPWPWENERVRDRRGGPRRTAEWALEQRRAPESVPEAGVRRELQFSACSTLSSHRHKWAVLLLSQRWVEPRARPQWAPSGRTPAGLRGFPRGGGVKVPAHRLPGLDLFRGVGSSAAPGNRSLMEGPGQARKPSPLIPPSEK